MGIPWSRPERNEGMELGTISNKICDNCWDDIKARNEYHRCKADPESCVEGTACPDYIDKCICPYCTDDTYNITAFNRWLTARGL